MIVIDDDDTATDQNIISDLDSVGCRDMNKLADANVIPNRDLWRERLVFVADDCFQPQSCLGREVIANSN